MNATGDSYTTLLAADVKADRNIVPLNPTMIAFQPDEMHHLGRNPAIPTNQKTMSFRTAAPSERHADNHLSARTPLLIFVAILTAFLVANLPGLWGTWFGDDFAYIVNNEKLKALRMAELGALLLPSSALNPFEWLPLRDFVYKLELLSFGENFVAFKLANFLFYAWSCVAAYFCVATIQKLFHPSSDRSDLLAVLFAASVFAAHPIHVESAQWISSLKDILMTVLGLHALWAFGQWLLTRRVAYAVLTTVLLACAGAAKGASVFLVGPLWLLAYAYSDNESVATRTIAATKTVAPLVLLPIAIFVGFMSATTLQQFDGLDVSNWTDRPLIILGAQTLIAIAPYPLAVIYAPYGAYQYVYLAAGIVTAILFAATCWRFLRRPDTTGFGILFFAMMTLPYLQLIPFSTTSMVADRFLMIAILGLAIAVADQLSRLPSRYRARAVTGVLAVLLALSAARAWEWQDPDLMQANDIERNGPVQSLNEYAVGSRLHQHVMRSIDEIERYGHGLAGQDPAILLQDARRAEDAVREMKANRSDIAAVHLEAVINLDVGNFYQRFYKLYGPQQDVLIFASENLLQRGKYREAAAWAQLALDSTPQQVAALRALGIALAMQGDTARSETITDRLLAMAPSLPAAACALEDFRQLPVESIRARITSSKLQFEQLCRST